MFEVHGHRGWRGRLPENTIAGCKAAVELGVHAIEIDLVVCRDRKLLVSHEPWFDHRYCMKPDSGDILPAEELKYNLFELPYSTIALFDCGSKGHPDFPTQKKEHHAKPLFRDLVRSMRHFDSSTFYFNIEIKSERRWYGDFQPEISEYVDIIVKELKALRLREFCTVQSFDVALLNALHKEYSKLALGLLVENERGFDKNMERLDFKPDFYNPESKLVTPDLIQKIQSQEMRTFVWTVNDYEEGMRLKSMGVDGIISDYPELFLEKK